MYKPIWSLVLPYAYDIPKIIVNHRCCLQIVLYTTENHIHVPIITTQYQHPRQAAYLRTYAIKILKKAIKMKCVRTEKQF